MSEAPVDDDPDADAREMDLLLVRARLTVIPERRDSLLVGFRDMKRHISILRRAAQAGMRESKIVASPRMRLGTNEPGTE